jgi:hypothetical protein
MIKVDLDRLKEPRYRKYLALIKWRKIVMDGGRSYKFNGDDFYVEFQRLRFGCSYCQYHSNCSTCELKYDSKGCDEAGHPHDDYYYYKTKKNAQAVLDLIKSVKVPERGGKV